jgi:aspartyl-tRNA(Asn)/glutamyl-tRNA(Gln) amidotransferase subunit C
LICLETQIRQKKYKTGHQNGIFSKKETVPAVFQSGRNCFTLLYMEVTDPLIDHLAGLSKLHFSPAEKAELKTDLQKMISFIEKLQELDTTGIEPLTHMGASMNALRADEIKGMVSREEALQNAPVTDGQFFKVPKVINPQS